MFFLHAFERAALNVVVGFSIAERSRQNGVDLKTRFREVVLVQV